VLQDKERETTTKQVLWCESESDDNCEVLGSFVESQAQDKLFNESFVGTEPVIKQTGRA